MTPETLLCVGLLIVAIGVLIWCTTWGLAEIGNPRENTFIRRFKSVKKSSLFLFLVGTGTTLWAVNSFDPAFMPTLASLA